MTVRALMAAYLLAFIASCAVPPQPPTGPTAEEIAKRQRLERARANLSDGMKKYELGNYDEATSSFLHALDSGQLTVAEQVTARKHMAFGHCLGGREANCKEEFEKIMAIDPKFDLSPAESGHPVWGPVHRLARLELEMTRSGRTQQSVVAKPKSPGEKLMIDALGSYDLADYNKAIKGFQDALKELLTLADQIVAHKFMAFSYCLTNRSTLCRAEFEAIFRLDSNFELAPAEAGHPSWGPSFRAAKAKRKPAATKK